MVSVTGCWQIFLSGSAMTIWLGLGHLLQVCCVPRGVPCIITRESRQPNSDHL